MKGNLEVIGSRGPSRCCPGIADSSFRSAPAYNPRTTNVTQATPPPNPKVRWNTIHATKVCPKTRTARSKCKNNTYPHLAAKGFFPRHPIPYYHKEEAQNWPVCALREDSSAQTSDSCRSKHSRTTTHLHRTPPWPLDLEMFLDHRHAKQASLHLLAATIYAL
jgi:hypothetical protein